MIFIKKLFLLSAIVATIVSAYVVIANGAMAQDTTNPRDTLIQKIATKFGLKVDDVSEVFDEHKKEMESEMKAKQVERLTKLVSNGKISAAQKQLILKKMVEFSSQRSANKKEIETWAKENGIDPQYLFGGFGKGGLRFRVMHK